MCKSHWENLKFCRKSCTINHSYLRGCISWATQLPFSPSTIRRDIEIHEVVQQVYDALKEKGYNPVNQLVGYILSEDPTYITTYKGARSLIRKVDRDDLLQAMLRSYLNV